MKKPVLVNAFASLLVRGLKADLSYVDGTGVRYFRTDFGGARGYAFTCGENIFINVNPVNGYFRLPDRERVTVMAEEQFHVEQFRRHGLGGLGIVVKYFWANLRHGYVNNPYELEARQHAASIMSGLSQPS